jgi:hypothetical protein
MTALRDDLLGVALPQDDPAASGRTVEELRAASDRLALLARGVSGLLPVRRWSGVASAAADERLVVTALALSAERARLLRAADALSRFRLGVAAAATLGDEAHALVESAYALQARADAADPALAAYRTSGGWSGPRADGRLYEPAAVALLDQARSRARDARATYDRAARTLAAELGDLSGRHVVRARLSSRTALDVVGLVPVVGDAVDAVNAAVYLRQGRWGDALLTGAAVVPGPEGWVAGGLKIVKALRHAGDVEKVVDDLPAAERAATHLDALLVRGRRRHVRLLPDDEAVDAYYRELLQPLGRTTELPTPQGMILVTEIPGGAIITMRRFSGSGGFTIDIRGVPATPVTRIHRAEGTG